MHIIGTLCAAIAAAAAFSVQTVHAEGYGACGVYGDVDGDCASDIDGMMDDMTGWGSAGAGGNPAADTSTGASPLDGLLTFTGNGQMGGYELNKEHKLYQKIVDVLNNPNNYGVQPKNLDAPAVVEEDMLDATLDVDPGIYDYDYQIEESTQDTRSLLAICGRDKLRRGEGRGDCRLQVSFKSRVGAGDQIGTCTAFQYSPDKFITAAHCFTHHEKDVRLLDPAVDEMYLQCGQPLDSKVPGSGKPADEDYLKDSNGADLAPQVRVNGYAMSAGWTMFGALGPEYRDIQNRYDIAMIHLAKPIKLPSYQRDDSAYRILPFPRDGMGNMGSYQTSIDIAGFPSGTGQSVCALEGYDGTEKYSSSGDIVAFNATDVWHDMTTCPGMSGSGVWQMGAMRGVHTGSNLHEFLNACFNRMVIFNDQKGIGFGNGQSQGGYLADFVDFLGRESWDKQMI